jgi:hypothetical protein
MVDITRTDTTIRIVIPTTDRIGTMVIIDRTIGTAGIATTATIVTTTIIGTKVT